MAYMNVDMKNLKINVILKRIVLQVNIIIEINAKYAEKYLLKIKKMMQETAIK